jgi:Mrp family chromosome partitioning ATPase
MLPVLGRFASSTDQPESAGEAVTTTRAAPDGPASGAYRLLSARIINADGPVAARTILVQGTAIGDGSDAFAADLAAVLAERMRGVGLVTSHVTKPTISVAGTTWTPDPGTSADDPAAARRELVAAADALVIHAPSLETSSAGLDWATHADVVVIVATRDLADRRVVAATTESLRALGARVVGSVLLRPAVGTSLLDRVLSTGRARVAALRD